MKTYKYLSITVETMWANKQGFGNYTSLNLYCTHLEVLEWLLEEVKKHVPGVQARDHQADVTGQVCFTQLHKLNNKDEEISRWLFKELCVNGWEPFNVTMLNDFQVMHLRFEEILD